MDTKTNINNLSIKPVLTRAIHIYRQKAFVIPAHQHFDYELIYSLNGEYECDYNGNKYLLKTGNWLMNCPGDWHTDIIHQDTHYIAVNFVFQDNASEELFSSLVSFQKNHLSFDDKNGAVKSILEKLLYENSKIDKFFNCDSRSTVD